MNFNSAPGGGKAHGGKPVRPPPTIVPPPAGIVTSVTQGAALGGLPALPPVQQAMLTPEHQQAPLSNAGVAVVDASEPPAPSDGKTGFTPAPWHPEKPISMFLLITKLAPELQENHMQQLLEQCGDVLAWRRGRGPVGEPLSFGFAQFKDAEVAWKAAECLSKRKLCGQELKVFVEEDTETLIGNWKKAQQVALRLSSADEVDWELERKAVKCNALLDVKIEELFGGGSGAIAQRSRELREREQDRIERVQKRKIWRAAEYGKLLEGIEHEEKRRRIDEKEKDDADRAQEESEMREKVEHELRAAKLDKFGGRRRILPNDMSASDSLAIADLVDKVQAETRNNIFRIDMDVNFLRDERIFEKKLRPWLERRIDLGMGGPQCDLVEYILRRINGNTSPDSLISDLSRYMDDGADPMIERMWRMLVFELVRGGLAKLDPARIVNQGAED